MQSTGFGCVCPIDLSNLLDQEDLLRSTSVSPVPSRTIRYGGLRSPLMPYTGLVPNLSRRVRSDPVVIKRQGNCLARNSSSIQRFVTSSTPTSYSPSSMGVYRSLEGAFKLGAARGFTVAYHSGIGPRRHCARCVQRE